MMILGINEDPGEGKDSHLVRASVGPSRRLHLTVCSLYCHDRYISICLDLPGADYDMYAIGSYLIFSS